MKFSIVLSFFIIKEVPFVHSKADQGGENLFLGKFPIPANTSDPINVDTSKAHPVHLSPLTLSAYSQIPLTLENTGSVVQGIPHYNNPMTYITGGPLGKTHYRYWSDRVYWTDDPDAVEGTTIDHKGAPIGYRVFFLNDKYSEKEALSKQDGVATLVFLTPLCENNKTNKNFIPLYNAIRKIPTPGSKVNITLSIFLQANDRVKPFSKYYAYPGPYIDQNGNKYFCATVIVFPIDKQTCVSREQLLQSVGLLKDSKGQSLTYQHSQYNATMPIVQAQGVLQIGIPI